MPNAAYHTGQKLYWVYSESRQGAPREVEIVKVGRKWLELSNRYRVDRETLCADGRGYSSPGRCHLSKEEYEQRVSRTRAWESMRRRVMERWQPHEGVDVAAIQQAERLLFPES